MTNDTDNTKQNLDDAVIDQDQGRTDQTHQIDHMEDIEPEIELEEFVDSDEEGAEKNSAQKMKDLREKLKRAVEEKQEYLTGWQKDKAEFINARKRDDDSNREILKYAEQALVEDLLPILDSFDAAMKSFKEHNLTDEAIKGLEGIYSQIQNVLSRREVKSFGSIGEVADPARYHAIGTDHTDDAKNDNTVSQILQSGYEMKGKVIRPAMVRVFSHNV